MTSEARETRSARRGRPAAASTLSGELGFCQDGRAKGRAAGRGRLALGLYGSSRGSREGANLWFSLWIAGLTLLVTGCPHNEYIVELKPHGPLMERSLIFYRQDGTGTNGLPNYQVFPRAELAIISKQYPAGTITRQGERRTVQGRFANAMPSDVGGAGSYFNLSNSLGSAGVYAERFRGDDNLTVRMEKRSKAADQLADLIIGWSEKELGHERNYSRLRRFLDMDFRRDLKNFSFYTWMLQASATRKTEATEEFALRFGQYLVERGYLRVEDLPDVFRIAADNGSERLMLMIQRLVATKLGIPTSSPMPRAVAMLADADATWKSWERYLMSTPVYRARLRHWQKEKVMWGMRVAGQEVSNFLKAPGQTNSASPRSTSPEKPDPSDVAAELTLELLEPHFLSLSNDDHLIVRLGLDTPPIHTNGKWDEAAKQVVWDSDIEERTNSICLPVFCYASWSEPNEQFQDEHFGRVTVSGEDLIKYCLWRGSLNPRQSAEWELLLAELKPTLERSNRIDTFRFSDEPGVGSTSLADLPRELIKDKFAEKRQSPERSKN